MVMLQTFVPFAKPRVTAEPAPTPGEATLTRVPPAAPTLGVNALSLGVIVKVVLRTVL